MISIANVEIKEAGLVYGSTIEKRAFDVQVNPADVLGAFAGGYVANRVRSTLDAKHQQQTMAELQQKQRIENDYYGQVSDVLSHLKIVFTPINVIYSVNGQVFEILSATEMLPPTKVAFIQKDGAYFRNLLTNKMNTEIQLAQQAFALQLLANQGVPKTASFIEQQYALLHTEEETFDLMKVACEQTFPEMNPITITLGFESLRPFEQSAEFFDPQTFNKVAGLFDYFHHSNQENLTLNDLDNQVNVGFLPDRVLFLHHGQLVEQLPLLGMNPEGYTAFRSKDKPFFLKFFHDKALEIANQIVTDVAQDEVDQAMTEHTANDEDDEDEEPGEPATSEPYIPDEIHHQDTPLERESIDYFRDADIHPMLYAKILNDHYGKYWYELELGALFKQLEVDFDLERGFGDLVWNKIAALYALLGDNTTLFDTSLAFEKFVRTMNDKEVDFTYFQANLELAEILFAMDVAESFLGPTVYGQCHTTIPQYVAEELFRQDVRIVASQSYDATNPFAKVFFDSVNNFLLRKWKGHDAHGILESEERAIIYRTNEAICNVTDLILHKFAERIDVHDPNTTISRILHEEHFVDHVAHPVFFERAVIQNVRRNLMAALYTAYKKSELEELIKRFESEVAVHV